MAIRIPYTQSQNLKRALEKEGRVVAVKVIGHTGRGNSIISLSWTTPNGQTISRETVSVKEA